MPGGYKKKRSSYETDSCGNVFGDRSAASFSYGTDQADRKYASPHAHSRPSASCYEQYLSAFAVNVPVIPAARFKCNVCDRPSPVSKLVKIRLTDKIFAEHFGKLAVLICGRGK